MLDDKFELKSPAIGLDHLKSRVTSGLGAVSGIMAKLSGLAASPGEKESTSTVKEEGKKTPEVEAKKFPDLGPVIGTEEVEDYSDKVSH